MHKPVSIFIFLLITVIVLGLNSFPNYYAYVKTPGGMSYSGQASWFDPWDINVYVAAIKWGQEGNTLLQNAYTTTQHNQVLMYPLYTVSGYLLRSIPPYLEFHILAIFFGFLLLFGLWRLTQVFIPGNTESLVATLLIALGGGIGWLFFPGFQSSDLFITGFTFVSHFQRPHEALGILLYMTALAAFYIGASKVKFLFNLLSLASLLLLVLFYPYYIVSYFLICGFYSLVLRLKNGNKEGAFYLLINMVITIPLLLLYLGHLRSSAGLEGVISQTLNTPGIFHIFSGYGILSVFILYQLKHPNKDRRWAFLNIWFFTSLVLSFLPFGFARFYLRTLFFPAVILTILSLDIISQGIHLSRKYLLVGLLLLLPISSFYMTYKRMTEVENNNHWYYLTSTEREALKFLDSKTPQGSGALSAYTFGNYIPANTDNKVYFGHMLQTPNSQDKINKIITFYSNKFSDEEATNFLKGEGINYILFGPEERKITLSNSRLEGLKYKSLQPVFDNSEVTIYITY